MRSLRAGLALGAGRAAGWLSRATGRGAGAQISGRVMLALHPGLLAELAADQRVVLVSATNGKTTTTHFLAAALEAAGKRVVTNTTGANLASGMAAALAESEGPGFAVLEVDERVLPKVVDALHPELLVLGNLSRDQLDRFGEVGSVTASWREVAERTDPPAVVANASDPAVAWAAEPASPTWIALGTAWRQDASTCPRCGALIAWSDSRFDCPACGFGQPATVHRLDAGALVFGGRRVPIELALPGDWNAANAALAIAAAADLGVDPVDASRALEAIGSVSGRYAQHPLPDGRPARVLLAKNPAGWSEVLRFLAGRDTGVVIALNAHIADGRDPSWLWDVPFELLRGRSVAASGERALDVAVRLDYAGVPISVVDDPLAAAKRVTGAEVHVVASYTQFTALSRRLT